PPPPSVAQREPRPRLAAGAVALEHPLGRQALGKHEMIYHGPGRIADLPARVVEPEARVVLVEAELLAAERAHQRRESPGGTDGVGAKGDVGAVRIVVLP